MICCDFFLSGKIMVLSGFFLAVLGQPLGGAGLGQGEGGYRSRNLT